jgi:membrane-associated phospholipid phosphatase
MSIVLEKTAEPQVLSGSSLSFHLHMAYACSALLLIDWFACRLTAIQIHGVSTLAIGFVFACAVVFTIASFWHEKGRTNLRDAILTVPWMFVLSAALPLLVLVAGRFNMPLQDANLAHLDQSFGVSVPQITSWASHHWLGRLINGAYPLLNSLIIVSALLPAFAGKVENAQQFLIANIIAFAVGLSLFALFPAIGPWYGYGVPPTPGQLQCQTSILLFRGPAHIVSQLAAIICFPSFHVMWAIFCAAALWGFRVLRIPVAVFSTMIVLSTVTTGWHYVTDVVGGILIAGISLFVAGCYTRKNKLAEQRLEAPSR